MVYEKDMQFQDWIVMKMMLSFIFVGTKMYHDELFTNGGTVLSLSVLGDIFSEVGNKVYQQAEHIDWQDRYYRHDIGYKIKKEL